MVRAFCPFEVQSGSVTLLSVVVVPSLKFKRAFQVVPPWAELRNWSF